MLKTLRVTSFIAIFLAFCGTAAMFFIGLKGDPEIKAFLDSPGVLDRFKEKTGNQDAKEDKISPLVAQARAFALRIDPPPPPKPPIKERKEKPKPPVAKKDKPKLPQPKLPPSVKSNLLATVLYKTSPERSLALLETTGGKQEWFRQGETVGHLEIQEIRDGSVVFTQGGKNPQEKFVPVKPTKSLLKSEQAASAAMPAGSSSITVQLPTSGNEQQAQTNVETDPKSGSPSPRLTRPLDRASRPRADISRRIRRARSVPSQPSPEEERKSIDKTISGIETIMSSQSDLSEEENKMWMTLMKELNKAKAEVDPSTESAKEDAKTESKDADKPAASKSKKP